MNKESLKELLKHPIWKDYCDLLEGITALYFQQLFSLDVTNPSNIAKIIEIKAKIDCLKEITYMIESETVSGEEVPEVNERFLARMQSILKKIWRKDA